MCSSLHTNDSVQKLNSSASNQLNRSESRSCPLHSISTALALNSTCCAQEQRGISDVVRKTPAMCNVRRHSLSTHQRRTNLQRRHVLKHGNATVFKGHRHACAPRVDLHVGRMVKELRQRSTCARELRTGLVNVLARARAQCSRHARQRYR